jgi:hypothetical protein
MTSRRGFLGLMGAGAALPVLHSSLQAHEPLHSVSADWDLTWTRKLTGKHKLVLDAPELERGLPLVRANVIGLQYSEVFGVGMPEVSRVLVLRHNAIQFVMNDAYWARFKVGADTGFTTPDGAAIGFNPVRIPRDIFPEPFRPLMLEPFQQSGGIILACNLALQHLVVPKYAATGMAAAAAYEAAKADMIPGITLQPSGIFAVGVAQESGCSLVPVSAA